MRGTGPWVKLHHFSSLRSGFFFCLLLYPFIRICWKGDGEKWLSPNTKLRSRVLHGMQAWPSAPSSAKAASGLILFSLGNTTLLFLHNAQEEAFKQLLKHLLLALLGSCPEILIITQEHGCGVLHTHKSQFYLQIADAQSIFTDILWITSPVLSLP